jgi:hypothetical protein
VSGEGEIESRRCSGQRGAWLTCGARGGYVVSKFCALDTHRGGTSGPFASGARTVWGVDVAKTYSVALTSVSRAEELRTVRHTGSDRPPIYNFERV